MDSLIEVLRSYHEERDRIEDAIIQELICKKKSKKHEINSGHIVKSLLDRHLRVSQKIVEIYDDSDGQLKKETDYLFGQNEFAEFYGRLRLIKEHYRRFYPDAMDDPLTVEFQKMRDVRERDVDESKMLVKFSDEEAYGKFIDLHALFTMYINITQDESKSYLEYLNDFDKLFNIPVRIRSTKEYKNEYLVQLSEYLVGFIERSLPLVNLELELNKAKSFADISLANNALPDWAPSLNCIKGLIEERASASSIDLSNYETAKDLEALGMDKLKQRLQSLGLKCGGTLSERANRLFLNKYTPLKNLDKKHFQSNSKLSPKDIRSPEGLNKEEISHIVRYEIRIYHLMGILSEIRNNTIDNVERKQSRTVDELLHDEEVIDNESEPEEVVEKEFDPDDDDSDEGKPIYNPKNLPLDIDGKPIPYWLYKLHGLNLYYSCEICGNTRYRGPKAFQRHFAEWRHAHGMKALGIPNSSDFAFITSIEDVRKLWEKMKRDKEGEKWDSDNEEEFEDSAGNVINKKVYKDLRRQGLL